MSPRFLLSVSLLQGVLLAGCVEPPPSGRPPDEEAAEQFPIPSAPPPEQPAPPPVPTLLRVPLPEALRESGGVLVVSRLHASSPVQESVTAVAAGTQEFEIHGTQDEVLAVSVLGHTGALSDAAMVPIRTPSWPDREKQPRLHRVPEEYATLQAAVDASKSGDTVLVAPGTYFETVRLKSGIQLLGSGATRTFLDARGAAVRLVDFSGATDVVVAGFTFQNVGYVNECENGDGIRCSGHWYSSALYADGHTDQGQEPTSALLMHNIFRNNSMGVMLYFHARAVVRNNLFVGNSNGLVANHFQDVALVANNVFWENFRSSIVSQAGYVDILNNVVARSKVGILHANIQTGRIRCNLFLENGSHGADAYGGPPRFEIGKDGNIEVDPLFVAPESGDFRPRDGSPLVDGGCFHSLDLDQGGTREDIGAHGGPLGTWQ